MTEDEVAGAIALSNYGDLDETTKKMVLSVALGESTNHNKKFQRIVKGSEELLKAEYEKIIELLKDETSVACPVCGLAWSRISDELKENLAQNEKYEIGIPLMRIRHIKSSHPSIWKLLAYLFEIPQKTEVGVQKVKVSNPESCSKEELAQAISESPELRKEFYKEWIKKLQERR